MPRLFSRTFCLLPIPLVLLIGVAVTQLVLPSTASLRRESVDKHVGAVILRRLDEFVNHTAPTQDAEPRRGHPPAPLPNAPLSIGACCGIGHRLERNLMTVAYAYQHNRTVYAHWPDVPWKCLFHDNTLVRMPPVGSKRQKEHFANGQPKEWWRSPLDIAKNTLRQLKLTLEDDETSTVYDRYVHQLLEMKAAQEAAEQLRQSLTDNVLSYLNPLRSQYATKASNGLHFCVHIRTGNNETGAWNIASQRRDIDIDKVFNGTLDALLHYANESAPLEAKRDISLFVASDNDAVRSWYQQRLPPHWRIISSGKSLAKPSSGVLFGEHGSKTAAALTQEQRNDAMAEAVADIFALGECSALFLPTYSSFTILSILLAKRRNVEIFYGEKHYYYKKKGDVGMGFLSDHCLFNEQSEWPWPKCWVGACGLIAKKSCRIDR